MANFLGWSASVVVVATVSRLSRNLGVFNSLRNVADAMTALHPILLTASKLGVAHFVDGHDHYVWIRVALVLRDLAAWLVLDQTPIEEWLTICTEAGLFLVAIEIRAGHGGRLLAWLDSEHVVSVSAQRSSVHERRITVDCNWVAVVHDWLLVTSKLIKVLRLLTCMLVWHCALVILIFFEYNFLTSMLQRLVLKRLLRMLLILEKNRLVCIHYWILL